MEKVELNKIYLGDTLEVLKSWPDEFVDCIVTSPPYFGLRDYGVEGQIGLEKTFDEYLKKMLLITNELKRVLKKTGTLWWNHGDSYGTGSGAGVREGKQATNRGTQTNEGWQKEGKASVPGYEKSLLFQNYRLIIRMIDEQKWILRNTIIWHKPNCMPSSVKDRFTVDFEPVFFFTKSKKYYFETQYEPYQGPINRWGGNYFNLRVPNAKKAKSSQYIASEKEQQQYAIAARSRNMRPDERGRNMRSIWKIPTKPYASAHFATFPPALIEVPIKAGCPKNGIVLDPFMGSGTTAEVACYLGRNYIGIELNPEYIKLAEKRLKQNILNLTISPPIPQKTPSKPSKVP